VQRLLPISPGTHRRAQDLEWLAEGLARAGCVQILLREPQLSERAVIHLATRLEPRLPQLILHDRMPGARQLARRTGWGLHLGSQTDIASVRDSYAHRLGVSCHSVAEARQAERAGADYVLLSPIYKPTSKPADRRPSLGVRSLRAARRAVCIPVFALGGMRPDRVDKVRGAGAFGVAVLGGIFGNDPMVEEVEERARAYLRETTAWLDLRPVQEGRRAR